MAKAKSQPKEHSQSNQTIESTQSGKIDIRINLLSQVAKQLKTVGTIAALLSLPVALGLFLPTQQPTAYPVEPQVSPSPEVVSTDAWRCRFGGGEWQELPTSCADVCGSQDQVCAQVVTLGCDCDEGQCWDGETCVLESETEPEPATVKDVFPVQP